MAALLHFPLVRGPVGAASTIATLKRDIAAALDRQQAARPVLFCHWLQDADGRLSCHWAIELPAHRTVGG